MNFPRTRRFLLAAAFSALAVSAVAGCDTGNPVPATPTTIRAGSPAPIPTPIPTIQGGVPQGVGTGVPAPATTNGPIIEVLPTGTATDPMVEVLPTGTSTAP